MEVEARVLVGVVVLGAGVVAEEAVVPAEGPAASKVSDRERWGGRGGAGREADGVYSHFQRPRCHFPMAWVL